MFGLETGPTRVIGCVGMAFAHLTHLPPVRLLVFLKFISHVVEAYQLRRLEQCTVR